MSGLAVCVCGEAGDPLTTPLALDGGDERSWVSSLIPPVSDGESLCWRFIDPYGDTVFNRVQLPFFIGEIDRLGHLASSAQQGRLAEIKALAEFALALPHRYLKFVGD